MFLLWYGIYVIVSIILITLLNWRHKIDIWMKGIVVIFLPIVGWLLPITWVNNRLRNTGHELAEYVDGQQREHTVRRIGIYNNIEKMKELNVIPLEDALVISEHQDRRQVMIDVMKQDTMNYIEILKSAVSNEDTETSYYAVSAIMEIKRKLLMSLQELSVQYEKEPTNVPLVIAYSEILRNFMSSGFLDERTLYRYQFTYLSVLSQLLKIAKETEWAYQAKIETQIKLKLFIDAEETAKLYLAQFPQSEEAYLLLLKVYFITRSKQKLNQTLDCLKKSSIILSNQALTTVRFWSEGA